MPSMPVDPRLSDSYSSKALKSNLATNPILLIGVATGGGDGYDRRKKREDVVVMRGWITVIIGMLVVLLASVAGVGARTEWQVLQTLSPEDAPIDLVVAEEERQIYVLTDQGELLIYDGIGRLEDRIDVGRDVKQIRLGPRADVLLLISPEAKRIRMISLAFIKEIDIQGAPFKGPQDAPVTMVIFSDFQCPYCSRLVSTIDQLHRQFATQVKLVFKQYPLRSHKFAEQAARASLAAAEQGQFWPFHDELFKNYRTLNDEKIEAIRSDLKLDADRFAKDMASERIKAAVEKDKADGKAAGVRGTPSLFVNGRQLRDKSLGGMRRAVEQALQNAR